MALPQHKSTQKPVAQLISQSRAQVRHLTLVPTFGATAQRAVMPQAAPQLKAQIERQVSQKQLTCQALVYRIFRDVTVLLLVLTPYLLLK